MTRERRELHEAFLYPVTRVRAGQAGGSGVIIYSAKVPESVQPEGVEMGTEYETYVLTCHHVIEDLIKIGKEWNHLAGREIKKETRSEAVVEQFEYKYLSRIVRTPGLPADIVAWDAQKDLALLRLNDIEQAPYFTQLMPRADYEKCNGVYIFDRVFAVGCGLGEEPVTAEGRIAQFDQTIDNMPYLLSTAPTIFGNSGGAVFHQESGNLIGISARIAVVLLGLGGDAITHMSYSIPTTTIHDFLKEGYFRFIYDPKFNSVDEAKERERIHEAAMRNMLTGGDSSNPAEQATITIEPYGSDN